MKVSHGFGPAPSESQIPQGQVFECRQATRASVCSRIPNDNEIARQRPSLRVKWTRCKLGELQYQRARFLKWRSRSFVLTSPPTRCATLKSNRSAKPSFFTLSCWKERLFARLSRKYLRSTWAFAIMRSYHCLRRGRMVPGW